MLHFFAGVFVYLSSSVFGVPVLIRAQFFLFPILFNSTHFIRYLIGTNEKLGVVLVGPCDMWALAKWKFRSDALWYGLLMYCKFFLTFLYDGLMYWFIHSIVLFLESILLGSSDTEFRGERMKERDFPVLKEFIFYQEKQALKNSILYLQIWEILEKKDKIQSVWVIWQSWVSREDFVGVVIFETKFEASVGVLGAGEPTILVFTRQRGFPGHKKFCSKTRRVPGKPKTNWSLYLGLRGTNKEIFEAKWRVLQSSQGKKCLDTWIKRRPTRLGLE